ncbi:MAG: pentapeptide repeat-containing protein [Candidatus Thiodiazotropha lotti]|nr:pentapeptide repeat-containing protein [Candidatus Thiodiazotropha endoloripes]MCG7899896.1 pentapeptide repeat-containing protein [Candidatus Thiodiazotropha weberae]MCG7993364.1 pentapeptide repeat-containing protein [Candidatus Thiodiazotropha lotti]MCG7901034.1 pentapeptide repeat-containing protein [Candidatus Thiodiazotropha weberae]MCG7913367.1 pentapeptide repeat-containing protein [Candidatus Thiodiazotropha weberae]MCG7998119.1 pentapeptide repeat-containing protein [Candidatus Th
MRKLNCPDSIYLVVITASMFWVSQVMAWTDNITETAYVNSICKLEPEAQCSWAILIDTKAPGVDMHESSLASARLDRSNFERANFSRSIFQLANLKDTNLMLSNLEHAHMHGVNLQNANLMLANLTGASLFDADLSGADLRGANLQGAILIKAKFDHAIWTDGRICAEGSIGQCN